jgi:hypothetical protein
MCRSFKRIAAFVAGLCRALAVTPQSIRNDRRGNLPPPEGGLAAF